MKLKTLLIALAVAIFTTTCAVLSYKLYENQRQFRSILAGAREMGPAPTVAPIVERLVSAQPTWSSLQSSLKDTVVQIFSNKLAADILQPQKAPQQFQSLGSGFFINKEGEIVTNAHVADQAKSMWIQIPSLGKEQIDVELVGISHDRDLALLRVKPEGLSCIKEEIGRIPYLNLGDSDLVHRADEVMAIGYPLGQQGIKSTTGVVSGREQHLIQISAPINPGSSGGPSLNLKGEVVGINTSGITDAQNVGYIIPINELKIVLDDLHDVKLLRRPFMGVFFNNGSETLTEYLGNPQPGGLFVVDIYKDSPMHKAGIQKHDMIYEINGHRLDIYGEMLWNDDKISLVDYISQLKLGQDIQMTVYRKGDRKEIGFQFYQAELLPIHKIYPGYEKMDYEIVAGMIIQPLTMNHLAALVNNAPGLTRYLDMKNQLESALIVTHIFLDSQAHRCRTIMPGCVLDKINGQEVKTLDDLRTALYKSFDNDKLTVETQESFFVVFPFRKILEEENRISAENFYSITPGIKSVMSKVSKDETQNSILKA